MDESGRAGREPPIARGRGDETVTTSGQLKAAVIGAGRMGFRHVQVVQGLGLDLVGVCDPRTEAIEAVARELGVPRGRLFTSPVELFREERPEVVIVSTTADHHCELTCLAAESGTPY